MSGAERIARYRAKHAATKPTTKTKSTADAIALAAEVARLKGESAELRKLNVALMREVAILKDESRARESL